MLLVSIILQAHDTEFANEKVTLEFYGDVILVMNLLLIPAIFFYLREVRAVANDLAHTATSVTGSVARVHERPGPHGDQRHWQRGLGPGWPTRAGARVPKWISRTR
eukprot:SAG22_NODE_433_length_10557_cov_6.586728_7_plen_106_part_00